jgi:hypothetical protein
LAAQHYQRLQGILRVTILAQQALTKRLHSFLHRRRAALLALASPLLILLALLSLLLPPAGRRLQALPALAIGSGLLITSAVRRRRRRAELLRSLRQPAAATARPEQPGL